MSNVGTTPGSVDPMAELPQAVLPSGVNYRKILPPGLNATTSEVRIYPTPGAPYTYGRQNQITFRLQDANFLDTSQSFLYVRVRNDCTRIGGVAAPAYVDGSAHSLFQSLRVSSPSGEQIEYIEEYGRLAAILSDIQYTSDSRATMGNALGGYGNRFASVSDEPVMAGGAEREFLIPLMSGFMSSKRYLPLGFYKGTGVEVQLVLQDPELCMVQQLAFPIAAGTKPLANGYTITECYFCAKMIQFTENIPSTGASVLMSMIREAQSTNVPLMIHSTSFDHNTTTANAAAQQNTHVTSFRVRSAKEMISAPRPDIALCAILKRQAPGDVFNAAGFTDQEFARVFRMITARPSFGISQLQWIFGNKNIPQSPLQAITSNADADIAPFGGVPQNYRLHFPQAAGALYNAFNRSQDINSGGRITDSNYNITFGAFGQSFPGGVSYAIQDVGTFAAVIGLESFENDTEVLMSGMDVAAVAPTITLNTLAGQSTVGYPAYIMDHWMAHDVVYATKADGYVSVAK